jgi:hypothetical protein
MDAFKQAPCQKRSLDFRRGVFTHWAEIAG